nr:CHY zinc finger protein [Liquorilactobacillus capillatus]
MAIHGINVDKAGRCEHYHQVNDIVGLKCAQCQQYFACYKCHDALKDHHFVACAKNDLPAICGACKHTMNFQEYSLGHCPYCQNKFNPKCSLHYAIYFK